MDLLLKTQIGRNEATFEDFAFQRELAPLLSDVLARNTIKSFKKVQKDLSYLLVIRNYVHADVLP
jgi:serine/threonine-protein kinase RIO1